MPRHVNGNGATGPNISLRVTLEDLKDHQFFSNWIDYPPPAAITASRKIMTETVERLIKLGPNSSVRNRMNELQECIESFNDLDEEANLSRLTNARISARNSNLSSTPAGLVRMKISRTIGAIGDQEEPRTKCTHAVSGSVAAQPAYCVSTLRARLLFSMTANLVAILQPTPPHNSESASM